MKYLFYFLGLIVGSWFQSLAAQTNPICDSLIGHESLKVIQTKMVAGLDADSSYQNNWDKIPNVFSPNGDGINDYFSFKTAPGGRYNFYVYTRSGLLVYQSESPQIFWDGRSLSGLEMRPGIYYFIIQGNDGGEIVKETGFVHLFR